MAMKRNCPKPNCIQVADGRYCTEHNREHEAKRGTRQQRGYNAKYDRDRKWWKVRVDLGLVDCWRCSKPLEPGAVFHLGHDDNDPMLDQRAIAIQRDLVGRDRGSTRQRARRTTACDEKHEERTRHHGYTSVYRRMRFPPGRSAGSHPKITVSAVPAMAAAARLATSTRLTRANSRIPR